jgi:hypothetical protein
MAARSINSKELFDIQSSVSTEELMEHAFSGMFGPKWLPGQVGDVSIIRLQLMAKGLFTAQTDNLLKEILATQLDSLKRFDNIWRSPNPVPDELACLWQEQAEAMERWEVFTSVLERFWDLEASIAYAFKDYRVEALTFRNEKARRLWTAMLKNEQQEFVNGNNLVEIGLLDIRDLRISNTLARLLDLLMDGSPKSMAYLLNELYGKKTLSQENKTNLDKRRSELNKALKVHWGSPPGKHWVERTLVKGEPAYRLIKPVETKPE